MCVSASHIHTYNVFFSSPGNTTTSLLRRPVAPRVPKETRRPAAARCLNPQLLGVNKADAPSTSAKSTGVNKGEHEN